MDTDHSERRRPLQDALDDATSQLDRVREAQCSWTADALPSASYYEAELRSLKASLQRAMRTDARTEPPG